MKLFKFAADTLINAKSEEEAMEIFANNSWDFASTADVTEVCPDCLRDLQEGHHCPGM